MKHFIEGLTEVHKTVWFFWLMEYAKLMYSTDELCLTRVTLSEAMLIRV